jgi:hypothetical protein
MLPSATAGGFGMHVSEHASSFRLASDAVPKLLLMAALVLILALWVWGKVQSGRL